MNQPLKILALLAAGFVLTHHEARAWSSPASRTYYHQIRESESIVEEYRFDFGRLPDPTNCWKILAVKYPDTANGRSPFVDNWGRELVYRAPGLHGEFDIYSVGEDGIDDKGGKDDVSSWLGVNDGYHWKEYWPRGRLAILVFVALGVVTLLARRVLRSPLLVPLAGLFMSFGVALGCYWLRHPGIIPFHNGPLTIAIVASGLAFLGFLVTLGVVAWRRRRLKQSCPA